MIKEVTVRGNQRHPLRLKYTAPRQNHLLHAREARNVSENLLRALWYVSERCRFLTWWAGLSSGFGNVSSHLVLWFGVKKTVWKWRCRHRRFGYESAKSEGTEVDVVQDLVDDLLWSV